MFGQCREITARWTKLHSVCAEAVFEWNQVREKSIFIRFTRFPARLSKLHSVCAEAVFEGKKILEKSKPIYFIVFGTFVKTEFYVFFEENLSF